MEQSILSQVKEHIEYEESRAANIDAARRRLSVLKDGDRIRDLSVELDEAKRSVWALRLLVGGLNARSVSRECGAF